MNLELKNNFGKEERAWWKKDIHPFFSFLILIAVILGVFFMGIEFVLKYLEIWAKTFYGG